MTSHALFEVQNIFDKMSTNVKIAVAREKKKRTSHQSWEKNVKKYGIKMH